MKRVTLACLILLVITVLSGSATAEHNQGHVVITVRGQIEGKTLRIIGKATVPYGAWIVYVAYNATKPRQRATGSVFVENEQFTAEAGISDWAVGKIIIDVNFQMLISGRTQPAAVIQRYGPRGEWMNGDDVIENGAAYRAAVTSTTVTNP